MRVLVAEDEVHLAQAIADGRSAEGSDVEVSHDGLDVLWRARERTYGVIVLDILLPGMNGCNIRRTLGQGGVWTPILTLTAKRGTYDEAEALDTGADDFLPKPFAFVVTVARLRALFRRGATPRPRELTAGDLALDPIARTCRRGDVPIDLTRREYALLEALIRHAEAGATKAQLLREAGGEDFLGDDNGIQVYVAYLRRKIDAPLGRHSLQSVRGIGGYRLVADG